jgi:hypothetical protein
MSPRKLIWQSLLVATTLLAGAVTCRSDQRSELTSVAASPPGKEAASSGAATAAAPGAAAVSAEQLVSLVAQRKLWPLKPEAVEDQLRPLGPWKREQPIPEALTLIGGRSGHVARSELSYSADGKKGWAFVGATFFVGDEDLGRLYDTLSGLIQKQLGKARWTRKATKGELPSAGWKLGPRLELLLRKSPTEGEQLIALMISEPQAGAGD